MRLLLRAVMVGIICIAVAVGATAILVEPALIESMPWASADRASGPDLDDRGRGFAGARVAAQPAVANPVMPLYGEYFLDDSGYSLSTGYTGSIEDRRSLEQVRAAIRGRAHRGIADLEAAIGRQQSDSPGDMGSLLELAKHRTWIATLHMSEGAFDEATAELERVLELTERPGMPPEPAANIRAMLGVAALRRGELANCVACIGPSSCILPIAPEAVHQFPEGSRRAVAEFTAYLKRRPEDLGVRWLLNLAHMTLGTYPDGVPPQFRIDLESPGVAADRAAAAVGRFPNVAMAAGLHARGANQAGGSVFDDFTGDGLPDIFTTAFDPDMGCALFVNRGDGTFEDRSRPAGLDGQVLALNSAQADYDNDGWLDVLLVRGGWENTAPLTLLRNTGGTFEDVTAAAGLDEPIACQAAAWGDYDNDGHVDLFLAGEYVVEVTDGLLASAEALATDDARNLCRLYRNCGDGTFEDVSERAGIQNARYAKGAAWGDYDDDGWIDLYVTNMGAPNRLYRNNGDGTFLDVAPSLGVDAPLNSFACWFWDYDNDGRLDIYATGYQASLSDYVRDRLGLPVGPHAERPRLYRNLGPAGFADVTAEVGLDRIFLPMGASVGDIDNDGYLDIYLATGRPSYSFLVPNVLLRNVGGRRFVDATVPSGTGHLQKGHGVSFADYDRDGDLDLFVELGGAVPGDRSHNALFRNPGHGRHWLSVTLVGTRSNRSALGARVRAEFVEPDGTRRAVCCVVGPGSSFGGNSLTQHLGLGAATRVESLTVTWPADGSAQTFRDLPADRFLAITEGDKTVRVLDH